MSPKNTFWIAYRWAKEKLIEKDMLSKILGNMEMFPMYGGLYFLRKREMSQLVVLALILSIMEF